VAFSVASLVDSRTILDTAGAEKLLGRGDMLFVSAEISKPKRLQGAFVSDKEIERVIRHIKEVSEDPDYDEAVTEHAGPGYTGVSGGGGGDELYDEARKTVVQAGKASASFLQRRLRIGYARAARLLDLLEENGVVGPADGAKPREILMTEVDEYYESVQVAPTESSAIGESADEEDEEEYDESEDYEEDGEDYDEEMMTKKRSMKTRTRMRMMRSTNMMQKRKKTQWTGQVSQAKLDQISIKWYSFGCTNPALEY